MSKKTYIKLYDAAALDVAGEPTLGHGPYKTFTLNGWWGNASASAFVARRPWLTPAKLVIDLI